MPEIIPNWHPIFVHFTVALLSLSVLLYVLTMFMRGSLGRQWSTVAQWLLWFGAGITLLTGLAGLDAFNSVAHDTPSHAAMTEHRNWAISVIVVFSILAVWAAYAAIKERVLGIVFVAAMLGGGLLLASTAWHGGELVYRFGLGVMSLPQTEGEGHDHAHGGHEHENARNDRGAESPTHDAAPMDFSGMDEGLEVGPERAAGHAHVDDDLHDH